MCRCIESMDIVIGGDSHDLFTKGNVYHCVIQDTNQLQIFYKIYGDEFDLSCTDTEFRQHFVIVSKERRIMK